MISHSLFFLALLSCATGPLVAEEPLTIPLGPGQSLELVWIPPGSFGMGSVPEEEGRGSDEGQHRVQLTHGFYCGKYPVTRGQFASFVAATGYRSEAEKGSSGGSGLEGGQLVQRKSYTWRNPGFPQEDDHPVVLVTFADAQAFCSWASRSAEGRLSLPTEAQWEYACRSGSDSPWYEGSRREEAFACGWFREQAGDGTRPVGRKKPNRFGLHDCCGQVYQWCQDWYGPYPAQEVVDPCAEEPGAGEKPRRVLRGGSWFKEFRLGRSAARYRNTPGSRNADNGFRVVLLREARTGQAAPPARQPLEVESSERISEEPPLERESAPGPGPGFPERSPSTERAVASESNSITLFVLMVPLLLALLTGFLVLRWLFGRRSSSGQGSGGWEDIPPPSSGPRIQLLHTEDDGFWIDTRQCEEGTEIPFRFLVAGVEQQGSLIVEHAPDGQFVYTGGRPEQIDLLTQRLPEPAQNLRPPPLPRNRRRERNRFRDSHSETEEYPYPSAY